MKLFIVRHGQTDMNVLKRLAGHLEAKLTEEGISQAKRLGLRLKDTHFDQIFSSDLLRARDTTAYLCPNLSYPEDSEAIQYLEILRERTWGEMDCSPVEDYRNSLESSGVPYHVFKTTGGESVEEVVFRAKQFLDSLFFKYTQGTFLISAHHTMNKALLFNLLNLTWEDWPNLHQENTCLNELVRQDDGTWKVDSLNCVKHLADG